MASRGPEGVSAFVIDASMAASWFLPDEANEQTLAVADRAALIAPLAPSLFLHEMRSLFVMAERRGRGARHDLLKQMDVVEKLFAKDEGPGDARAIAALAFKHGDQLRRDLSRLGDRTGRPAGDA